MKIKNIMSKKVISCNSSSNIHDVATVMRKYNVGFIPIIDDQLIGVITDRDIVIKCVFNNDDNIKSYVSNNIVKIDENDNVYNALKLMRKNRIKRLIVTKEKEIVGILSLSDILNNNYNVIDTLKSIYGIKNNELNSNPEVDEFYL